MDFFFRALKQNQTYLNIKLSGGHITEVWLPKQPLKPPCRVAPESPELAAVVLAVLKLVVTLHLNGGSEAPCSETPHLDGTTSEVEPASLGVQWGFPHQHLCVCICVCLTDAFGVFCCCLCAHQSPHSRSACIAA